MLTAAVIGCGRMGAEPSGRFDGLIPSGWLPVSHAESFMQARNVNLVALAEINSERLEWAGKIYHINELFKNYNDLFKSISPDIIGVATRTPDKLRILQDACDCGVKGVYIEKPFANNLLDSRKILNKARDSSVIISYGVNRRYHLLYRQARDLIRAGEIGDLIEIIIEFGESPLLWSHPHSVDLIIFLSGQRPIAVQAELVDSTVIRSCDGLIDSDPIVSYAQFWLDGGVRGLIIRGGGCNVRVNGTHGSLEILSDGASIQLRKSNSSQKGYFLLQQTIFPVVQRSATVVAIEALVANVNGELVENISNDEIYFGMQMLWGCVFSHLQQGKKYLLAEMPDDLIITGRVGNVYA